MAKQSLCSVPDCGKPHMAKGFCNNHYSLFKRHGDPLGGRTPPGETTKFLHEIVLKYHGMIVYIGHMRKGEAAMAPLLSMVNSVRCIGMFVKL